MRKLLLLFTVLALPAFLSGCRDPKARSYAFEIRDTLKARGVVRHTFDVRIVRAICNLDRTVADAGLTMPNPDWAYCPPGIPDPDPPPDPIPDPWGDDWEE